MSTYLREIHCLLDCLMSKTQDSPSPVFSDILFIGACYMWFFPELRRIFRRRFIKKSFKFVSFITSVGVTSFLMLVVTAAQARSAFCRYLRPIMNEMSPDRLRAIGILLMFFFVIFNVFLSRTVRDTANSMCRVFTDIRRIDRGKGALLPNVRDFVALPPKSRSITKRPQRLPANWKKITRSGTIYGH
ncbi:hypothetical protein SNE40_005178 [Patella caerulea]|uniref:Uncharacterized protein n=1 Tax=Patella caerulea TaxID=87958 RepID=A0AAN8PZ37_PATCE